MAKLRIIPLGGLGEVGKNMMAYEYGDDIMIVDTGIMFPENDMLGVDYIIPDFQYLKDKASKVKGIVITHGHEDHIGAISHVLERFNVPIYATPLTLGLIEVKLARDGLMDGAQLVTIQAGESFQVGKFKVEFAHVCHSIPDCVALGIETPEGFIVHTGDYKFDHTPVDGWPTDYAKLAEWSARGVLAMLGDSTNADKKGWTPSERVIDDAFDKVFRHAEGRIIVASFASLISRMQQVAETAERHGRKMAFAGVSMRENAKMAIRLGYLKLNEELIIPIEEALKMKPNKIVIMGTGTQGEPSSIVGRLSVGTNRQFDIKEGDTLVLSSHPIPGNEEMVSRTINRLLQRGATVIYDPVAPVHVSGHASQEEMKLMLHLVKPKYLIPVHGELRHLRQHANMAEQLGIPKENVIVVENGRVIEFEKGKMKLAERVPGGYVFVDGSRAGEISFEVVREREQLSRDGVMFVNLVVSHKDRHLMEEPEIITRGFIHPDDEDGTELLDRARQHITDRVASANGNLREELENSLKSYLHQQTRRRPMVFVVVNEV
ncbi:MAG: ribonuclease J [Anaerolineae bacterium]|nr:MAG: ribonuclease J [Anaerolineae bacterium]